jgi:hypothetical protein
MFEALDQATPARQSASQRPDAPTIARIAAQSSFLKVSDTAFATVGSGADCNDTCTLRTSMRDFCGRPAQGWVSPL